MRVGTDTYRTRLAATALALTAFAVPLEAQNVTLPALKAAFLLNFARFSEWPQDAVAPGAKLVLCVANDEAVVEALKQTVKARSIDSHELTVASIAPGGQVSSCHLLYVSGLDLKVTRPLLERASGAPIFTVGDTDTFAASGGVAQFFLEGDRMRFAISLKSAERARLKLSSRLLALARLAKDDDVRH